MAESGVGGGGVDAPTHSIIHGLGMGAGLDAISTDGAMREAIGRIMGDVADPHLQRTVEETLQEMATGAGSSTAGGADAADPQGDGHIAASVFSALARGGRRVPLRTCCRLQTATAHTTLPCVPCLCGFRCRAR